MAPLTLGPLVLDRELVFLLLSLLSGYVILKYRMVQTTNTDFGLDDVFINSILLGFLVWKFSLILFDPIGVMNQPIGLLYFDGGSKGTWLAVVAVLAYLLFKRRRKRISWTVFMDAAAVSWFGMYGAYHLLLLTSELNSWLIHVLATLWSLFWLGQLMSKNTASLPALLQTFQWVFIGYGIIEFLSKKADFFIGLHLEQALYLFIAAVSIIGSIILGKTEVRGD